MTIGYICESNPFTDRHAWSGTIYNIREAIEQAGFEVVWIPFDDSSKLARYSERLRWKLYDLLGKKQILGGAHFLPEVYAYSKSIKKDAAFNRCDVLFFPRGGQVGLFLKTNKPIIYYSDATAHVMVDYYWKNCHPLSVKMACFLEKKASQKAFINLRSSQWATNSVIQDCKCPAQRCLVLEFGANMDAKDIQRITPYEKGQLRILFSGVDWERKGGDIGVETVKILRDKGIDAHLDVVGIRELPAYCKDYDFITNHGFLNKNNPEEYRNYISIFRHSHILLLPTQAECSAIVYCEAAGFGLPTYTYATGGTENYVIEGINGHTLRRTQQAIDFASCIIDDIEQHRIGSLHEGALRLYQEKLSWPAWSKRFKAIIHDFFPDKPCLNV